MSEPNDMRAQILDATTRLFAAHGYEGTSLSAIADEVGIKKPSLLYHFPSKAELRRAVMGELLSRWNEVLPRLLQAATTGTDRFESLVGEVIRFFADSPDSARLLNREMLDRPEAVTAMFREYLAPWLSILSDYIARGQAEGSVHPDIDAETYLLHVIHLIVGGIAIHDVTCAVLEGDDARERVLAEMVRMARASLFTADNHSIHKLAAE
jgi:AcrR family transcriptional regulator